VTDIIDLIDQVTTPTCGHCDRPLRPDGPSLDFCGETCAEAWNTNRTPTLLDRLTPTGRANVEAAGLTEYATGGLIPSPAEFRPQSTGHVPSIAYDNHPWHTRFTSDEPNFLTTTPLPGFQMVLTDGRTWGAPPTRMPGPWTSPDGRLTITCERRRDHHILRVFDGQHVTVHQIGYVPPPLEVIREVCRLHELDRRRADAGYPDPRYPGMRFTADGSWDVTEQRTPWQHQRFPAGARFTIPGRPGIWTITQHAEQSFEELTQDRAPQFDYAMRNEQRQKIYVTHEFLTDAVGVRRLPDIAE